MDYAQFYANSMQQQAQYAMDDKRTRTIYVGNLSRDVSEQLLESLFSKLGTIIKIYLHRDSSERDANYAFVEFAERDAAIAAQGAFNGVKVMDREIKVGWPTGSGVGGGMQMAPVPALPPGTELHSVYVGELSPEVNDDLLRMAFSQCGTVMEAKVICDNVTGMRVSRGFGFVAFASREEAEDAIRKMNGQWIGQKQVKCNWATRKTGEGGATATTATPRTRGHQQSIDEIIGQAPSHVTTVYVGGIPPQLLSDEVLRQNFQHLGTVQETKIFRDKGYGFIKFSSHEEAAHVIFQMHGQQVAGQSVKVSWGKEFAELQAQRANQMRNSPKAPQQQQQQQPMYPGMAYGDAYAAMMAQQAAMGAAAAGSNGYYQQGSAAAPSAEQYAAYYAAMAGYNPYAAYAAAPYGAAPGTPYAAQLPPGYNPAAYQYPGMPPQASAAGADPNASAANGGAAAAAPGGSPPAGAQDPNAAAYAAYAAYYGAYPPGAVPQAAQQPAQQPAPGQQQ